MNLLDAIKKKGFKLNILKIPTRRTPRQIEHKIRTEFDRERVIGVLAMVEVFLTDPNPDRNKAQSVLSVVQGLKKELSSYKE